MDNLAIYNKVRKVPAEAQKAITGGRLKGMTDINPMWRIKTLTEQFGPVGLGWYYEIIEKRVGEGANGEKVAFVDINLFVKFGEDWSNPIVGTGGSSFVAKEKSGLYTSDECFKMALTDAISVACKALGVGADVYYEKDRSKYDTDKPESEKPVEKKAEATSTGKHWNNFWGNVKNLGFTQEEAHKIAGVESFQGYSQSQLNAVLLKLSNEKQKIAQARTGE